MARNIANIEVIDETSSGVINFLSRGPSLVKNLREVFEQEQMDGVIASPNWGEIMLY